MATATQVIGGDAFDVVKEDNWYVCSQEPGAGSHEVQLVTLIVDREDACADPSPNPWRCWRTT